LIVGTNTVKAIRTVTLKISGSTKADGLLVTWLKAVNWLSAIVFKTEELNSNRLAKAHYANLRQMGLPSQLACSAFKTVCATYKTAKANKRWRLAKFSRTVLPAVWKRHFNRTKKGITLWGDLLSVTDSRPLPDGRWKDSKLKRVGKQWFLILTHEVEIPEPKSAGCIVGVDMGIKRMLVATNSANAKPFFFHGGVLNHRRSCIRRTRAAVQSVGTRSARRLLKRMSGHEAAVTAHLLHIASKALVSYAVEVGAKHRGGRTQQHTRQFAEQREGLPFQDPPMAIRGYAVQDRIQGCGCRN
jgi:putative transposase